MWEKLLFSGGWGVVAQNMQFSTNNCSWAIKLYLKNLGKCRMKSRYGKRIPKQGAEGKENRL